MSISINWGTKIIYIPKADLTLVQSSPEVRQIDLNWFRMQLKDLEDGDEGMAFLDTHRHNTEATLSGLVYARIIEIINGYTVEFQDGQYTVNCVGANHNLSDVKVPNQVSLIVNNAAGLISNAAIEYSSFNGGVTVDLTSPFAGTLYPIGTPQMPCNNWADALMISSVRGFTTFYVIGNATLGNSQDFDSMIFVGESQSRSNIVIEPSAEVEACEFYDAHVSGTLDGNAKLKSCVIDDLTYIYGIVEQCLLEAGDIVLGGSNVAQFIDCWSGSASQINIPYIDMGGAGQNLIMRNYNGAIGIKNLTGAGNLVSIDLNSGVVVLDSTVTAGVLTIRGVGTVTDNSTGTAMVNTDDLINPDVITRKVWDEPTTGHQDPGTFGGDLKDGFVVIARALGLSQENQYLDQTTYTEYSGQQLLTSGRIRIYTDAASVGTANNVLATYTIAATYNAGRLQTYKVTKV